MMKNIFRVLLILVCFVLVVGFGACGLIGVTVGLISINLMALGLGVVGLAICILLYKLAEKISSSMKKD
ncbi:hypothetical protein ACO0LM_20625 [Undibacterium sp. Di26W]|uniref:hypothetical protein n=1 Tax=Undibacterium sp. Di26W TaxID=3413035 RepID=UPI003BF1145E